MNSEGEKQSNWPKDYFGQSEMAAQFTWLFWVVPALLVGFFLPWLARLSCDSRQSVIVYAAQDQVYAEPILKTFERETGIRVRAVYDSEAVKTVGLVNRLLAERDHPQCDVFWGNEELRAHQLAATGAFRETNGWTAFGYRSRRIAINTNKLSLAAAPRRWLDLTNETWRGKIALAYPLFGTTATHFMALRQHWGETNWLSWCRALAANQPFIVDGNSVVVQFVARAEAWIGLTDSDDIAAAQRESQPVTALPLTVESLPIPNTVAVVRRCPHPDAAQRLYEFLQRREIAGELVNLGALEGVSQNEMPVATLRPEWTQLLLDLDSVMETLKRIFRR